MQSGCAARALLSRLAACPPQPPLLGRLLEDVWRGLRAGVHELLRSLPRSRPALAHEAASLTAVAKKLDAALEARAPAAEAWALLRRILAFHTQHGSMTEVLPTAGTGASQPGSTCSTACAATSASGGGGGARGGSQAGSGGAPTASSSSGQAPAGLAAASLAGGGGLEAAAAADGTAQGLAGSTAVTPSLPPLPAGAISISPRSSSASAKPASALKVPALPIALIAAGGSRAGSPLLVTQADASPRPGSGGSSSRSGGAW